VNRRSLIYTDCVQCQWRACTVRDAGSTQTLDCENVIFRINGFLPPAAKTQTT